MTKKDYQAIAIVLGNKLAEVSKWKNIEAQSLSLAYIEDFMRMLAEDNAKFDRGIFIAYIQNVAERNGYKGELLF